jgi:hypothetical protein
MVASPFAGNFDVYRELQGLWISDHCGQGQGRLPEGILLDRTDTAYTDVGVMGEVLAVFRNHADLL